MDIYATLRGNLRALMEAAKDGRRRGPGSKLQLEADSGVGKSTIYRIFDQAEREAVGLDKLQRLADAFGLPAWALLLPGLDPVAAPIASTQARLDALAEEAAQKLLEDVFDERRRLREEAPPGQPGVNDPFAAGKATADKPARRARIAK